jgi:DNA polymerase I-like protein with 3'-5' exonuclease and polymerase domains
LKLNAQADTLRQWLVKGVESQLLLAKLKYSDAEGFHRYASMLDGRERVFPDYLPTQASGRWSTTDPPLVNFPPSMDDVIMPDEGTYWIGWDLEAIEGRISSAHMRDTKDLDAFNNGWDIHTITACLAWKKPLPPILDKRHHKDPSCAEWRALWEPGWEGKDDRRRHLAKIARYALLYAKPTPGQERAILLAKDIEKQGLDRGQMLDFAKLYLKSKPQQTAFKIKFFAELAKRGYARTFLGRRRRLYGDAMTKGKEGWSFTVSGSVSDIMNMAFIEIQNTFPEAWLIKNGHDAGIWSFPLSTPVDGAVKEVKRIVNRTWDIDGVKIYCPGEFYTVDEMGTKVAV